MTRVKPQTVECFSRTFKALSSVPSSTKIMIMFIITIQNKYNSYYYDHYKSINKWKQNNQTTTEHGVYLQFKNSFL
jgi:hypothetical protein